MVYGGAIDSHDIKVRFGCPRYHKLAVHLMKSKGLSVKSSIFGCPPVFQVKSATFLRLSSGFPLEVQPFPLWVSLLPPLRQGHRLHVAGGQLPLRRPRRRHRHAAAHQRGQAARRRWGGAGRGLWRFWGRRKAIGLEKTLVYVKLGISRSIFLLVYRSD